MKRRSIRVSLVVLSIATAAPLVACGDDVGAGVDAGVGAEDSTQGGGSSLGAPDTTDGSDSGSPATTGVMDNCVTAPRPECPPAPGAIPTETLEVLLAAGVVTPLDVRGADAFATEHIAGATVLDAGALRATVDGVGGQVAPPDEAQAVFESAGITPGDALVVYSDGNDTAAARVVWTLSYYGHTGRVWMLDGGLDQWRLEDRAVETGPEAPTPSQYSPQIVEALRVDAPWVLAHLDDPGVTLVDARNDAEFSAGHIPGALSVDWVTNLDADGLFRPDDELGPLYGDPLQRQTLVVYCQTGSRASVDWLVLAMLGYPDVRIYDGSWAEWSADPSNPQE